MVNPRITPEILELDGFDSGGCTRVAYELQAHLILFYGLPSIMATKNTPLNRLYITEVTTGLMQLRIYQKSN